MKRCRRANAREASRKKEKSAKKETHETSYFKTTILDLHSSILTEIFLSLPPISIICCKFVCKEWYELLSQSLFCNLYLRDPPCISLLLSNLISRNTQDKLHLISLRKDYESSQESIPSKRLNLGLKDHLAIKGSCNGLLYLMQYDSPNIFTCINNPMTGEYICLPKITSSRRLLCRAHGFGFSTNYKVLIVETYEHPNGELRMDCQIFTIGVDGRWRALVVNTYVACGINSFATIFNGAFHWLVDHESITDFPANHPVLFNSICAFDIVEERFRSVPPPPGDIISNGTRLGIGELREHLCVFDGSRSPHRFDIWIMNEYGNARSWTRIYVLRSWIPSPSSFRRVHLPIASWRDGEVLAHSSTSPHLLSFNVSEEKVEVFDISGFEGVSPMLVDLILYTPNFLPLKEALKVEAAAEGKYPKIANVWRT